MPKFNAVVGNPPFDGDLHLTFLERAYKQTDRFVSFVHPSGWLTVQKPGRNTLKTKADRLKNKIGNSFVGFELIDGNSAFSVMLAHPCVITTIDKTKTTPEITLTDTIRDITINYDSSFDINPMMIKPAIFNSIKRKIWTHCGQDNINDHVMVPNGNFFVNIPNISGNVQNATGKKNITFISSDYYQLVYVADRRVTNEPLTGRSVVVKQWVAFQTWSEAQNCLNYLADSELAKFALMIVKFNIHLDGGELRYVPWFDFSQLCTDEIIYALLDLTPTEIAVIKSVANSNGSVVCYGHDGTCD